MTPSPFEKSPSLPAAIAGLAFLIALLPALLACTGHPADVDLERALSDAGLSGDSPPASAAGPGASWRCRNDDVEVECAEGRCEAETGDGFTPMSVSFDDSGAMSVCAYSGCWEGNGEVFRSGRFLVLIGHDMEFSTSRESESSAADILIALDRVDGVATLKAGAFAQPLLCKPSN